MTLVPDLAEFEALGQSTKCVIGCVLDQLESEQDRVNLVAALAAAHIGHTTVASWLRKHDLPGRDKAVKRHRMGECGCG